jgi:pyruvate/2-oxoglutarate dehydrogenase complex dihydrolipoamide dehydrogenase (E3) component
MKVLREAGSRKVLGAAVLGIEGDEVIHSVLDTMCAGASAAPLERAVHINPTLSVYLPTLLHEH